MKNFFQSRDLCLGALDTNSTWAKTCAEMRETMNIVVITGASSGMGREFAMQLDRGLHSVDEFWLIARRGSRLKEIASGMLAYRKEFCRLI